ncbi:MAG TPA: hypothetical protein VFX51_01445 [Solirubrobacteraceae bacterium]|nr:hypothetical protein [Solirubrobacteraceae bacterium]
MRRVLVLTLFALALACAPARAQDLQLAAPFAGSYSVKDLGPPPGVPSRLGGLTLKAGTTDRLLIGGEADGSTGALYEVRLVRDAGGHVTGFTGTAKRYADAAYNDGGVTYGPGNVLFLARWPTNELGQTKPGSATTDKVIDVTPLGVASSLVGLAFVPPGMPGTGRLKLVSYSGGQWYDAGVAADGTGTFNLVGVTAVPGSTLTGGVVGFVYVNAGSRQFSGPSMLVSEYQADGVAAYAVDGAGNPIPSTRRSFITGLDGADGAFIDPLTGDFLFSTFGGGDRVVVVRGFASPLPPPVAGKKVNALPTGGTVKVKLPGENGFTELEAGEQIPVGTTVDVTKGRVALTTAGGSQATFYAGVFKIGQPKGSKPLTTLTLVGKLSCAKGKAAAAAKKKRKRRLWGDGKGRFRTKGKHSAATVVGTKWLVEDRCGSTLTRVARGRVSVRDFAKKKTVVVKAGKKYVAKP